MCACGNMCYFYVFISLYKHYFRMQISSYMHMSILTNTLTFPSVWCVCVCVCVHVQL